MAYCQAYGCSNQHGKTKAIHYFSFPNVEKDKLRVERWLHNIGTCHTTKSFKFNKNKKVCSDHFHPNCYLEDKMAKMLGYTPPKVKLKNGAIPTIFVHKMYDVINMSGETIPTDIVIYFALLV